MKKNKLAFLIGALMVVIQFFQPDRSTPPFDASQDFLTLMAPPAEVSDMVRVACYDCHSYQTQWPWYSYFQPVGWLVGRHVREGRAHLNLSEWGNMSEEDRAEMLEEMAEEVSEGEMPLKAYALMHPKANLSEAQRAALSNWLTRGQPSHPHEEEDEDE